MAKGLEQQVSKHNVREFKNSLLKMSRRACAPALQQELPNNATSMARGIALSLVESGFSQI